MPVLKRKWLPAYMALIITGAFLLLSGVGRHPVSSAYSLKIYRVEGAKRTLVYSEPVAAGQELLLAYRHSADGTPVEQIFQVGEDYRLILLEERYGWYGAGLEFGSGLSFSFDGEQVRITGYQRTFEELPVRVAMTVPQYLVVGEERLSLAQLADAGSLLLIAIE